jgi:hypothetical protein
LAIRVTNCTSCVLSKSNGPIIPALKTVQFGADPIGQDGAGPKAYCTELCHVVYGSSDGSNSKRNVAPVLCHQEVVEIKRTAVRAI